MGNHEHMDSIWNKSGNELRFHHLVKNGIGRNRSARTARASIPGSHEELTRFEQAVWVIRDVVLWKEFTIVLSQWQCVIVTFKGTVPVQEAFTDGQLVDFCARYLELCAEAEALGRTRAT